MEVAVTLAIVVTVTITLLAVFGEPFLIAKGDCESTPWTYLVTLVKATASTILIGRVLGWW